MYGYDASLCYRCDFADGANPHWGRLNGPHHGIGLQLLEARAGHAAQMRFLCDVQKSKTLSTAPLSPPQSLIGSPEPIHSRSQVGFRFLPAATAGHYELAREKVRSFKRERC